MHALLEACFDAKRGALRADQSEYLCNPGMKRVAKIGVRDAWICPDHESTYHAPGKQPLRILIAHNRYQQRGGEDVVVEQEIALLRSHGVDVEAFVVDNDALTTTLAKIKTAAQVAYSWEMRTRMARLMAQYKPDLLHVHNSFPRLTPSIYDAAGQAGLRCPVVQTLHNFRLTCLNGTHFRAGAVCQDCLGKTVPLPGIRHRCYRGDMAGSASVAWMLAFNRLRGAWSRRVDRCLVLTSFARDFMLAHTDLAAERVRIKPNAAPDPGVGSGTGGYALFVGRLSPEKGIDVLLEAARLGLGMKLRVAGQGPLESELRQAHAAGWLEYLGPQTPGEVTTLMQQAAVLLVPSLWYEGLPMVLIEALATGLPVIASRIGSLATLIEQERTGLLFEPGSAAALVAASRRLAANAGLLASMRQIAREQYLRHYHPEANYKLLRSIYEELLPGSSQDAFGNASAARSLPCRAAAGVSGQELLPARGSWNRRNNQPQ